MSRNAREGRYAGKTKGKHVRTQKLVGKRYKQDEAYCMHTLLDLPAGDVAWGIQSARELFKLCKEYDGWEF